MQYDKLLDINTRQDVMFLYIGKTSIKWMFYVSHFAYSTNPNGENALVNPFWNREVPACVKERRNPVEMFLISFFGQ